MSSGHMASVCTHEYGVWPESMQQHAQGQPFAQVARCQTNGNAAACRKAHSVTQGMEHATGGTHGGVKLAAWGRRAFDSRWPCQFIISKIPLQHGTRTKLGQPFPFGSKDIDEGSAVGGGQPGMGAGYSSSYSPERSVACHGGITVHRAWEPETLML